MNNRWNTQYISSQNIDKISRGKSRIALKYLKQFQQLIPPKVNTLRKDLAKEDRQAVRQTLHNICPQLQFFEVPQVVPPIQRISKEFKTIPWPEMEEMVEEILDMMENAVGEVDQVLRTQF